MPAAYSLTMGASIIINHQLTQQNGPQQTLCEAGHPERPGEPSSAKPTLCKKCKIKEVRLDIF
jgi:hypothetical protein